MIIKKKDIAAKAISIGIAAMMTSSMITPTFAASYKWPLGSYRGQIANKFGEKMKSPGSKNLRYTYVSIIGHNINNRKVYSAANGKVIVAKTYGGFGKYIRVKNNDGKTVGYRHLNKIAVKKGQKVKRGTYIGKVGKTGCTTIPHLSIDMQKKVKRGKKIKYIYVNPMKHLKQPKK